MTGRPTKPLDAYPVADEAVPLPPPGAEGEPVAPAAPAPTAEGAAARPAPEVAVLRFIDPAAVRREVPLGFPFEHEGQVVSAITVRRLNTAEVGAIIDRYAPDDTLDLYDFYAAMTGLPAPVLRGLIDDDAVEVRAAANPFLPLGVRQAPPSSPTSETGAATPSSPPGT